MTPHQLPREQVAIERYLERAAHGQEAHAAGVCWRELHAEPAEVVPPKGANLEQWVREEGCSAEERAQRARVAAKIRWKEVQAEARDKARQCVTKTSASTAAASTDTEKGRGERARALAQAKLSEE